MRGRLLNMPVIGRAAGFTLIAAMIVAAAVHLRPVAGGRPGATVGVAIHTDPLAGELARCQAIGPSAQSDGACEAAWAENRRRFFTYRAPTQGPAVAWAPANPTGR